MTPDGGHRAPAPTSSSPATIVVLGGVILVCALLGAGVALAFAGWKGEAIGGLLGVLGTIAGVLLAALGKLAQLGQKVDQVAHQTNGALQSGVQSTVRSEVRSALADHGLPAMRVTGEQTRPLPRKRPQ